MLQQLFNQINYHYASDMHVYNCTVYLLSLVHIFFAYVALQPEVYIK